jgi:hypothetical protein
MSLRERLRSVCVCGGDCGPQDGRARPRLAEHREQRGLQVRDGVRFGQPAQQGERVEARGRRRAEARKQGVEQGGRGDRAVEKEGPQVGAVGAGGEVDGGGGGAGTVEEESQRLGGGG